MLDLFKKIFNDEKILTRIVGLLCILSSIIFIITFAVIDKLSSNGLYAIMFIGILGVILLFLPEIKNFSYKKGDTEIELNSNESEEK